MRGLVQPCDAKFLPNVQLVPRNSPVLVEAFFEAVKELIAECFQLSAAKNIHGKPATGILLVSLIEGYLRYSWENVTSKNLWRQTCTALNTRLTDRIVRELNEAMPKEAACPSNLEQVLSAQVAVSREIFHRDAQDPDEADMALMERRLADAVTIVQCTHQQLWSTYTWNKCCNFFAEHSSLAPSQQQVLWQTFCNTFTEADPMVIRKFAGKIEILTTQEALAGSAGDLEQEKHELEEMRQQAARETDEEMRRQEQRANALDEQVRELAARGRQELLASDEAQKTKLSQEDAALEQGIQDSVSDMNRRIAAMKQQFKADEAAVNREIAAEDAAFRGAIAEYERQRSLFTADIKSLNDKIADLQNLMK